MSILMQLSTGRYADFEDIDALDVTLEDVAHHLALRVRFGGACRTFYSVAQHACRVSDLVEQYAPEHALTALHHDDTEYLIGDMVKPLKVQDAFFAAFEDDLHRRKIAPAFGVAPVLPSIVKWADTVLLIREMIDLLPNGIAAYDFPPDMVEAADGMVAKQGALAWYEAKAHFLVRHHELVARNNG